MKIIRPGRVTAAIAFLVLCASLFTACADSKTADVPDSPGTFNVLLTHKAGGGSFEKLAGGAHRLTLHNVAAKTNYSAEQPEPASGETTTRAVIDGWDPANPPVAAVVITDPAAHDSQDVMLVRLTNPKYDEALAKLSVDMQIETNYQGNYLKPYVADADASLPAAFGQVSVIVDSKWFTCGKGYIQCYRHYGCCSQPFVTMPLGSFKVSKCWEWSRMGCEPCSEDPCATQFPSECGQGTCYDSCLDASACTP